MKQNLTKKPVISSIFSVTRHNIGMTDLIVFFLRECLLRSWVINLLIFKKSVLVLVL